MRRNLFYHNNPQAVPQNYHFQQMNGNQLVNRQSPSCNCIKLAFCNPVMEMARKMYSGFIADYINSQLQVVACNYIDGEMAVCCPPNGYDDNRQMSGRSVHGAGRSGDGDMKWVWNDDDGAGSEEVQYPRNPSPPTYPMNQYMSYPIHNFFPYGNNPFLKNNNQSPFLANHEDPYSLKSCPPSFSNEFKLPDNHTFFKEPETAATPIPRTVELTTQAPEPTVTLFPGMLAKMKFINDDSCGRSVGSRIIGGEDAGVGRFSWLGRLAYKNKSKT